VRDQVRTNPHPRSQIEQQFSPKNTMGYGLNALLDHDRPVDILTRLIVGSEGTLAFIGSIVMRTVARHPHARTGLLVFPDLAAANRALPTLAHGVDATHRSPSCCRRSVGGSGNYGNRFYAAVLSPGPRPVVARARYLVMLVAIDQMTSARMPGR